MATQIALLRAVNVAAFGTVKMADLKAVEDDIAALEKRRDLGEPKPGDDRRT